MCAAKSILLRLLSLVSLVSLVSATAVLGACANSPTVDDSDARRIASMTYVVTGASSGFGRGVAVRLGALGANVVLAARRTSLLEEVAQEVRRAGGNALPVTADVSRPQEVQQLMSAALARFGKVDVWINNAGVGAIGPFANIPLEDHARLVDVNLKGVIYGSHVALQHFRQRGSGTLVNIGSVESEVPLAYQASYAATKAGVLALDRALNEELRLAHLDAVRVATVMPWAADTPFFVHAANYSGRQPDMVALDPPEKVVEAIVWTSVNPREELPVGWKAFMAVAGHRWLPDLAERASGDVSHQVQMERSPPAPNGPGAIHQPINEGRGVSGRMRDRR